MYKKGRFWVVAGITVTAISFSPLLGRADTQSSTGTATAATTDGTQQSSGNTVTLQGQSATTAQAAEEVTATQQNDSGTNTVDQSAKNVTTQQSSSDTNTVDQKTQTDTTSATPQTDSTSNEQPVTASQSESEQKESTTNDLKSNDDNTASEQTSSETGTPKANKQTVNVPTTTDDSVTNGSNVVTPTTDVKKTTTITSASQPVPEKMTARAAVPEEATIVEQNTFGSSAWTLDSNGVLTIHKGTWGPVATDVEAGSWYNVLKNVTKVVIDGDVTAGDSLSYAFFRNNNNALTNPIADFEGLENIHTSNVTQMNHMFSGAQIADFSGLTTWDVSKVTNMYAMFGGNQSLKTIDLSAWDVSNVTTMGLMFSGDSALENIDLSSWGQKTSNVTEMSSFLSSATNLKSANLSGLDLSNVVRIGMMFANNTSLKSINLSGVKTSSALQQMYSMFQGDYQLESLDLSGFDTTGVTNKSNALAVANDNGNFNLKSLTLGPKTNIDGTGLPAINAKGYTGNWVNADDASMVYSSAELMALYNGTTNPTDTITWVWEKAPSQSELTAKDVNGLIAGPNTKWGVADSVATLKDADGNDILGTAGTVVKVLSVNGDTNVTTVDTTTAGTYTVVLSYTDATGEERQATSTVTVIENKSRLIGQDTSINMGTNAALGIQAVVDPASTEANGNQLTADEIATVTATGLDVTKAGAQKVTLTYVDSTGTTRMTEVTVTMVASKASLTFEPSTVIQGPDVSWDYGDHLTGATDFYGNAIDADKLTDLIIVPTEGQPDLSQLGPQTVTFTYTDELGNVVTATAEVTVVTSQAKIETNGDQVVLPKDAGTITVDKLVKSVTGADGQPVTDLSTVTMSGYDPQAMGVQTVTLSYTDAVGNVVTAMVKVTVDHATITTRDTTPIAGPGVKWDYTTNLKSVTDSNGEPIDLSTANITFDQEPDLSEAKVGTAQPVTFTYTDDLGQVHTATATVTTVKSQIKIETVDQLVVWPDEAVNLTASDFVTSLSDSAGRPITDFKDVAVTTIDPDKVGPQTITLTYTDEAGNQVTGTTELTVDHAQIVTQDTTPVAGPNAKWDYTTNLKTVTDSKGQPVNLKEADITVLVEPDLSPVLIGLPQEVKFTYTDDLGKVQTVTATVTTVASKADLQVQGGQIVWPADAAKLTANDFVTKLTGADGTNVTDFSGVTMSAIDPAKAGVQTVTLTYTDAYGNQVTKQTTVTVDQATIKTQNTTPIAGPDAQWDYLTNLATVTDANGSPIDAKNATIKVINAPDLGMAKLGISQTVTFEYTDNLGKTQRVTATVTTVATQAAVVGRDQTIVMGPNASWQLSDSLDAAKNLTANGTPMTAPELGQIVSDTQPNLQRAGTYELTLSYVDAAGNLITGHATVTVVASQADLQVKDSQLTAGGQWRAADNFVSAKDANGQPVSLTNVTVQGTVDMATPGQYQITYTYTDAAGNVLTKTATVTVLAESVDPDEIDDNNGGTKQPGNNNGNNGGTATQPGGNGEGATIDPGTNADQGRQTNSAATNSASDGVTGSPAATVKPQAGAATTQSALPKTAERSSASTAWGLAGLSLVGLLSALGGTRRRREDQ